MNIGIEATLAAAPEKTGVGQYAFHLIRALAQQNNSAAHRYSLYLRQPLAAQSEILANAEAHLIPRVLPFPYLWAQLRLPFEMRHHPQDVYFFPSSVMPLAYIPKNSVITVHDVAFLFFPDCFAPSLRRWLKVATQRGIQKAAKIIAVSEATRQDILTHYTIAPERVVTIHHGVHERFTPQEPQDIQTVKQTYGIAGPYLLCLGTLQRRKNIPRLLEAFAELKLNKQLPHQLVLIGRQYADLPENEIFATIKRLFLDEDVIWTGYVPEQNLPTLIGGADVFVLPSLYEGFGMPILEAMACGVPVACSGTSALPEVLGDAGLTFDPYSVKSMVESLSTLLSTPALHKALCAKGLKRAAQFTWNACARKTLAVFESVTNGT